MSKPIISSVELAAFISSSMNKHAVAANHNASVQAFDDMPEAQRRVLMQTAQDVIDDLTPKIAGEIARRLENSYGNTFFVTAIRRDWVEEKPEPVITRDPRRNILR